MKTSEALQRAADAAKMAERKPRQVDRTKIPLDTRLIESSGDKCYAAKFGMVNGWPEWHQWESNQWIEGTRIATEQPWTVWLGGECPVPEGLEVEILFRDGVKVLRGNAIKIRWSHVWHHCDIIAYRLTGRVLDGWVL